MFQDVQIHACLLGGAVGDALGAEIEFWSLSQIRQKFPVGMNQLLMHDGIQGAVTDDTQMTLFTTEGLIRALVWMKTTSMCHMLPIIHHALLRWYVTQGGRPHAKVDNIGLATDERLRKRRAPGNTCLDALGQADSFGELVKNQSKGCGTIMRIAPIAFIERFQIAELAEKTSALTHGHPTAQEAAAAWALILNSLARGEDIETAARAQVGVFGSETDNAIAAALYAPRDAATETVEKLGSGWVAEEALAIALYAVLCAQDFEHGLKIAVTHSGDSDSTGAIAGNALGLIFPEQVKSHRWSKKIECADLIERISGDLAHALRGDFATLRERYPGH